MQKQKSTIFIAVTLFVCLFSSVIFSGCDGDKKETSTETIVTDTIVTPPAAMDTTHMDTAATRPIVPGS